MCAIVEEYANEVATERENKLIRNSILNGFKGGVLTKKGAAVMYPKIKEAEIDLLYQEAKKPVRRKKTAK